MRLSDFNIVYINLKKRSNKREYIEKELKKIGLLDKSLWLEGVDGSNLKKNVEKEYLSTFRTMAKKKERILGRIGCYLSHKEALAAAIKSGLDNILILEDDCKFIIDEDIELPDIPKNADILYFGGLFWNQKKEPSSLTKKNSKLEVLEEILPGQISKTNGFLEIVTDKDEIHHITIKPCILMEFLSLKNKINKLKKL